MTDAPSGRPAPDAPEVFHIEVATDTQVIEQSSVQSDYAGARKAAIALAEGVIRAQRLKGGVNLDWRVVLKNQDFAVLETIRFWQVINGR